MLTILLAESALETIPNEIAHHSSVKSTVKRRNKKARYLILDGSLHHSAMRKLPDNNRRGRPDIIHTTLLSAFESILNLQGELRVLVHTYQNKLIRFDPQIRFPKNFNRYIGLMEQLFQSGRVPESLTEDSQEPLMRLEERQSLEKVVTDLRTKADENNEQIKVIVMSPEGRAVDARDYFQTASNAAENILCIIGGFPEGDYNADIKTLEPNDIISIYPGALKTWTVASEVLVSYRQGLKKNGDANPEPGGKTN
jgi:rRNA small subunit pseudouridine methyltransferase Nep1